jgi:hypothetical protein
MQTQVLQIQHRCVLSKQKHFIIRTSSNAKNILSMHQKVLSFEYRTFEVRVSVKLAKGRKKLPYPALQINEKETESLHETDEQTHP